MQRLIGICISLLAIGCTCSVLFDLVDKVALAESSVPSPSESMVKSGTITVNNPVTTVFWPLWPDGTQATGDECGVILSPRTIVTVNQSFSTDPQGGGYFLNSNVFPLTFEYMIVCTRSASGTVAVQESTWGEVKTLYRE